MTDDGFHKTARRHVFTRGPSCGTCQHIHMGGRWCDRHALHPRLGWPGQPLFLDVPACNNYCFGPSKDLHTHATILEELKRSAK